MHNNNNNNTEWKKKRRIKIKRNHAESESTATHEDDLVGSSFWQLLDFPSRTIFFLDQIFRFLRSFALPRSISQPTKYKNSNKTMRNQWAIVEMPKLNTMCAVCSQSIKTLSFLILFSPSHFFFPLFSSASQIFYYIRGDYCLTLHRIIDELKR